MITEKIGNRIKELRKLLGISIDYIFELSNVKHECIQTVT